MNNFLYSEIMQLYMLKFWLIVAIWSLWDCVIVLSIL